MTDVTVPPGPAELPDGAVPDAPLVVMVMLVQPAGTVNDSTPPPDVVAATVVTFWVRTAVELMP
jgi:hypothetical protein